MTRDQKKSYLNQYSDICQKIADLQLDYEKWETMAESMTQKLSDMPHSSEVSSKIESASIEMVNIQGKINQAMEIKEAIENGIYGIKGHGQKQVLEDIYINNMSVRDIAKKWNKNSKSISRMHGFALDHLTIGGLK